MAKDFEKYPVNFGNMSAILENFQPDEITMTDEQFLYYCGLGPKPDDWPQDWKTYAEEQNG